MLGSGFDRKPGECPLLVLSLLALDFGSGVEDYKHAKNGCTASDVQYNLIFEDVPILVDCISV